MQQLWDEGSGSWLLCQELPKKLSCSLCFWDLGMSSGLCKHLGHLLYQSTVSTKIIHLWLFQENFLLLCPAHASHRLPCDRSKAKKKTQEKHPSMERHEFFSLISLLILYTCMHEVDLLCYSLHQ